MEYLSPRDGGLPKFAVFLALFHTIAATAAPVPTIRVLVEREKEGVHLEGFDLVLYEAESGRQLAREDRRSALRIKCSLGGKMNIQLGKKRSLRVNGPLKVASLGGFMRVEQRQYRDDLYIHSFNGDCIVVNHVDLEKYVAGLLNSEMSSKWPMDALKAQAIAARTYAIYQMKESSGVKYRKLKAPFDLFSTVKDQVYEGAHQERYRTMRAVRDTQGMILAHDGMPIKAFYHSTCGGRTELPEKVWGKRYQYIRAVKCESCVDSPRFNWVFDVKQAELESKLREKDLLKGALLGIRVTNRNSMGRADKVEVRGSLGTVFVPATRIRDLFGTASIMSTDFTVVRGAGKVVFVGHGSGHGVGMCQWGAKGLAERGQGFAAILKHYYPAAEVTRLY